MPTYSFTVTHSFDLATYRVQITANYLKVINSSTNEVDYYQSYVNGKSFRCSGNTFEIGTLTASQVFINTVDLSLRTAGIWVEEENNANRIIGATVIDDPGVHHSYNMNQCPVNISKNGTTAYIKCPCENESGPCGHTCYVYGD